MIGPGLFDLNAVLEPGSYQLSLELNDGSKHNLPVLIEPGKIADITVGAEDLD
jgi:hypothetical protein